MVSNSVPPQIHILNCSFNVRNACNVEHTCPLFVTLNYEGVLVMLISGWSIELEVRLHKFTDIACHSHPCSQIWLLFSQLR